MTTTFDKIGLGEEFQVDGKKYTKVDKGTGIRLTDGKQSAHFFKPQENVDNLICVSPIKGN